MTNRPERAGWLSGLVGALVLASTGSRANGQFIETPEQKIIPSLVVTGEAELRKPADELQLSFAVVTENAEPDKALEENNRSMEAILAAIKKVGLKEDEYETGRFEIRPRYSRRPRAADQDWRPTIVDYEVTNNVLVRTSRMNLAGELIGAATRAGANSIDRISFGLADQRRYQAEALAKATANALADAATLADAAGVRLVRLLSVSLDQAGPEGGRAMTRGRATVAMDNAPAPPITPGDVTIVASVTVKYEIAAKESEQATERPGD